MHGTGDLANLPEVAENALVTVNVSFEDFPVVDSRLPRSSGVHKHESRLDLLRRNSYRLAMDSIDIEMNRIHAAVKSRIVVLASSGNFDELSLDVLCDLSNLLAVELAPGVTCESRDGGNHQCRGS